MVDWCGRSVHATADRCRLEGEEGARAGYGKACEQVVRGGGAGVVGRPREEDGCGGGLTCELDS
jgi:hypothetical protein